MYEVCAGEIVMGGAAEFARHMCEALFNVRSHRGRNRLSGKMCNEIV